MGNGIVLVLLALLLLGGRGRGPSARTYDGMTAQTATVVWPVPSYVAPDGHIYDATVSSGMDSMRGDRPHRGLDIMYKRRSKGDRPEQPPGVKQGDGFASSAGYFAPVDTPVLAVKRGTVWSVEERTDGGGWSVVLDHGKPWATYYTHIRIPLVLKGQEIDAGDIVGLMGGNASDASAIRHLHFEVWYDGHGAEASVDAWTDGVMNGWRRDPWQPS